MLSSPLAENINTSRKNSSEPFPNTSFCVLDFCFDLGLVGSEHLFQAMLPVFGALLRFSFDDVLNALCSGAVLPALRTDIMLTCSTLGCSASPVFERFGSNVNQVGLKPCLETA